MTAIAIGVIPSLDSRSHRTRLVQIIVPTLLLMQLISWQYGHCVIMSVTMNVGGKEGDGEGEGTLAAVEGGTGRVFMWRVGRVDGGVPRRAFPVCVIGSPGAGMGLGLGERSKLVQLAFVVGRGEGGEEVVDGGEDMGGESSAELGIVVGHGDWTAAYAIPQEALL